MKKKIPFVNTSEFFFGEIITTDLKIRLLYKAGKERNDLLQKLKKAFLRGELDIPSYRSTVSGYAPLHDGSSHIIDNFCNKVFKIYNGKVWVRLQILQPMVGSRFGQFSLTKKIGASIHDSLRNQKKRDKIRRKIIAKKPRRKTTTSTKSSTKK